MQEAWTPSLATHVESEVGPGRCGWRRAGIEGHAELVAGLIGGGVAGGEHCSPRTARAERAKCRRWSKEKILEFHEGKME